MVAVRIKGDDTRKDENGIAHVTWSEAQEMVAAGAGEIIQGEPAEEPAEGDHETEELGAAEPAPADAERTETGNDADLDKMTRAELNALATERGVDVSDAKTKADVIAALKG